MGTVTLMLSAAPWRGACTHEDKVHDSENGRPQTGVYGYEDQPEDHLPSADCMVGSYTVLSRHHSLFAAHLLNLVDPFLCKIYHIAAMIMTSTKAMTIRPLVPKSWKFG